MYIKAKQSVEVEITKEELFNTVLSALGWSYVHFNSYLYKDNKFYIRSLVSHYKGEWDWEECYLSEKQKEDYLLLLALKERLI